MKKESELVKSSHTKGFHYRPYLSSQLYLGFAIFAVVVLVILWVLQVIFLGSFYQAIRLRELRSTANYVSANVESDGFEDNIENVAVNREVCVLVFNENGKRVASCDIQVACVIHNINSDTINSFYDEAVASGGESIQRINQLGHETEADGVTNETPDTIVMTKVVTSPSGNRYIVLLNAAIAPVSATVNTIQRQLVWVSGITIILALIFAVVISRTISRPITKLNRSAKALANGYYGADFSVTSGCREVGELSDTLAQTAKELSKADIMQKELIANISHDLRTPLTLIKGYGEVMRDIPGEMSPENMQVIIDETERLSSLVSDLVDLSKFQSGESSISPDEFDLGDTVKETVGRYRKLTEKDGYQIEYDCEDGLAVFADKTRILQVIYNLINNAINYTGDDKRVFVRAYRDGDVARVEVRDTGEGIEADKLALIWDRYYKIDKVHRRAAVGTGLGLSIVKNILVMHGAGYGVDSIVGKGSTFWFELKLVNKNNIKGEQDNGIL